MEPPNPMKKSFGSKCVFSMSNRNVKVVSMHYLNNVISIFVTALKKAALPPIDNGPRQPLRAEDVLNGILPPREWVEQGKP